MEFNPNSEAAAAANRTNPREPYGSGYLFTAFDDENPLYKPGTIQSQALMTESTGKDPFLLHNVRASLAQIRKQSEESQLPSPGLGGAPTTRYTASAHANWYTNIGLRPGEYHQNEEGVILALERQRARTKDMVEQLKPFVERLYKGAGLDPSDTGLGDAFLKSDPQVWADELERIGAFNDQTNNSVTRNNDPGGKKAIRKKEDFLRYVGTIDSQMGVSAFSELRNYAAGFSPIYNEGRVVFERMNARNGYRIPRTAEGVRQLESLTKYRQYLHDSNQDGFDVWSIPQMFVSAIGNVAKGVSNIAVPDDEISEEWRKDPEKYQRVTAALTKFREMNQRFGSNPLVNSGIDSETAAASRVQGSEGLYRNQDRSQVIVTNPERASQIFVEQNIGLARELAELYKAGAFTQNGRVAPLASALDGLVIGTTGLAAMLYHSEDPNSFVNSVKARFEDITYDDTSLIPKIEEMGYKLSPEDRANIALGRPVAVLGNKPAEEVIKKIGMIESINSALEYREAEANWMRYGWAFRTNGGEKGKTYFGDFIGLTGDDNMLQGAQILADPFVAAGLIGKGMKMAKAARTASALTARLAKGTAALERFAKAGAGIASLPDTLRPLVENIRTVAANSKGIDAAKITEMDVLTMIERGEARVMEPGLAAPRPLTKSELASFSDEVVNAAARVEAYHAQRLEVARRIAQRNAGAPLSTWGKWIGQDYMFELGSTFENPVVQKVIKALTKVGIVGKVGQTAAADVSRGALNRSAIFGAAKTSEIWKRIVGGGAVAAGAFTPFSVAGYVVGGALLIPDVLSLVGLSGNGGKYLANYLRYYGNGKQIGGSIAAARLKDIASEIERLKAFRNGTASLTSEEIRAWKLGEISAGRMSAEQIRTIERTIEVLEQEAGWVQNLHALGFEKLWVGGMKEASGLIATTAILDTMMKANDSQASAWTSGMFAISGNIMNSGFGAFFRNTSNVRRRLDINRVDFYNITQSLPPDQAQRLVQAYTRHRALGTHDSFVAAITHLHRIVGNNTSVLYTDRAGMAANSILISAGSLIDSTSDEAARLKLEAEGKAKGLQGRALSDFIRKGMKSENVGKDAYNLRTSLMREAEARGLRDEEAIAFVQTELEKRLSARASVEQKREVESRYVLLSAEKKLIAEKIEKAHVEEAAALEILQQSFAEIGIPLTRADGSAVSFNAEDLSSAPAFVEALKREAGDSVVGGIVDGKPTGLMAMAPDQFKDMFERFKLAQYGLLNVQKGKVKLISEFNTTHTAWEAAAKERVANIDVDAELDTRNWRRGSTFAYTDFGMGGGPGVGYVVTDGVFVVDRPLSDGTIKSDIVLNLEDMKIGPVYEELAHAIFVSSSFRGFRNLIEKNLFGDWQYNAESGTWIGKNGADDEPTGNWLTRQNPTEGVLVSFDEKGNPTLPALRLFAEAYSDGLNPEAKTAFMAKVDRAEEIFRKNPELGIRLLQDVTNEIWAFGYRQRLMNASPGSFRNSADGQIGNPRYAGWEGSALVPNAGDAGPGANSKGMATMKVLFAKLLTGEVTANEAAQMIYKINKGDFGPMSPSEMQFIPERQLASIIGMFSRNGIYDRLAAKTLSQSLKESGLSPEIFGTGDWTSNRLFHESTGEPLDLPSGLRDIVDTAHYFVRDRISETDPYMFEDYSIWDSKTGEPFEVWPNGHPLAGQPVNHVLYAAIRGNMNLIDGRTGRLRNLAQIITEERRSIDMFSRIILNGSKTGEISSFQLEDGSVYINGATRMTKAEASKIISAARESKMAPNQLNALITIVSDLADSNPDNPITPERAGRLPIYSLIYRGVEQESRMGRHRRVGGILSDRSAVIYNIFTDFTGIDANGRPILDERGNQIFIRAVYANTLDMDALGRRFELFWNGQLRAEDGNIPSDMRIGSIRSRFRNKAEIQEVVDQYLVHIAEGGRIARDLKDIKMPSKTAVETFTALLISQGKVASVEEAEKLARMAHFIVGSRASDYILTGKRTTDTPLGDVDIGSRKLRDRGSIPNPVQAANDMNFPITTIRLDRVVSLSPVKAYGSEGGNLTFPWTQHSTGWVNAAYSSSSGFNTIIPPKGSGFGIFLQKELAANTNLEKQVSEGVRALYSHPLGYKIIHLSDNKYHVYDADSKFVKTVESYGDAVSVSQSHARLRPIRSNSQFDALMNQMGFTPVGLETVNHRGIRRANFLTPDKQFMIRFNNKGVAQIIDAKNNTIVAKNIGLELLPDNKFDFTELQAALQLSYDNVTLGAGKLDLSMLPEEDGLTPMQRFLTGVSGISHRGLKPRHDNKKLLELQRKYGPDFVEFTPVVVGRSVQGKKVFSFTNQAYYNIKAKLIDAYGHKGALAVLSEMKKELGDETVATSDKAVVEWFDKHLQTRQSEEAARAREMEIKEREARYKEAQEVVDKKTSIIRQVFVDPINKALTGINAKRAEMNIGPVSEISPVNTRQTLLAEVADMKAKMSATVEDEAGRLASFRAAMDKLGKANETLSRDMFDTTAIMWKNNAGYLIMMDMLDQPVAVQGVDVSINMSWLAQKAAGKGQNYRVRFRVYNPNGAFVGYYNSRREMAERFLADLETRLEQGGGTERNRRDFEFLQSPSGTPARITPQR